MGSGNITGEVSDSQVNIVTGDGALAYNEHTVSAAAQDPWPELRQELARIRLRLENNRAPVTAADRDDAMKAVTDLEADVPRISESGPDAPIKLRQRVKGLLGVLAPVAEVIGGVAALEAILSHL
jgi:hypothetical protein